MCIKARLPIALSPTNTELLAPGWTARLLSSMSLTPTYYFHSKPSEHGDLPQLQIQKRADQSLRPLREATQILVHGPCGPYEGLIEQ